MGYVICDRDLLWALWVMDALLGVDWHRWFGVCMETLYGVLAFDGVSYIL